LPRKDRHGARPGAAHPQTGRAPRRAGRRQQQPEGLMPGGPADGSSAASDFSVSLLAEFLRLGVRDVVLSPGSRSQALALAAAEFEKAGRLRLHVRIDERVAAFVALGLAVES